MHKRTRKKERKATLVSVIKEALTHILGHCYRTPIFYTLHVRGGVLPLLHSASGLRAFFLSSEGKPSETPTLSSRALVPMPWRAATSFARWIAVTKSAGPLADAYSEG